MCKLSIFRKNNVDSNFKLFVTNVILFTVGYAASITTTIIMCCLLTKTCFKVFKSDTFQYLLSLVNCKLRMLLLHFK